jgi:hypothetical protein
MPLALRRSVAGFARKRWDNNEHYYDANEGHNDKEDAGEHRRIIVLETAVLNTVFQNEAVCHDYCVQDTYAARLKWTIRTNKNKNKPIQWPLVRKRTIPTEWPPLVGQI